ncbi:hypothetical protein [Fodinicola feengrottensis]|uniref:Uncharacterized protein n=1 Tax=Fodinicola feengrottensis TaxID=435914 RepID=A0ABN2GCX1_9ACTN|nr:hypothetical protein [Fodinicola feengrottensis]
MAYERIPRDTPIARGSRIQLSGPRPVGYPGLRPGRATDEPRQLLGLQRVAVNIAATLIASPHPDDDLPRA